MIFEGVILLVTLLQCLAARHNQIIVVVPIVMKAGHCRRTTETEMAPRLNHVIAIKTNLIRQSPTLRRSLHITLCVSRDGGSAKFMLVENFGNFEFLVDI